MISVQTASAPSAAPLTHNQGFLRHCPLPIALRRTLSAHQQTAHSKETSSVFRDFSEVNLGESHADLSPNDYIRIKPRLWARETACARLSMASFTLSLNFSANQCDDLHDSVVDLQPVLPRRRFPDQGPYPADDVAGSPAVTNLAVADQRRRKAPYVWMGHQLCLWQ